MTRQLTVDVFVTPTWRLNALRDDVRRGLTASQKTLPPVWFYDEAGSVLFDRITRLHEYYPTRAERGILAAQAGTIANLARADTLVELGSGTSEKTRLLLDAMASIGTLRNIVLLDISEEILREAASSLMSLYDVDVYAVVGDLRSDLTKLPRPGRQLWAFLGSTIGNFTPAERKQVLSDFRMAMGPDDHFLLGTDLVKDRRRLVAAYDDSEGVTAAFNRNVLKVINRELSADFDPTRFDHVAVWNAEQEWMEMRLRSRGSQMVTIAQLDLAVSFAAGEDILTEISSKFRPDGVGEELNAAGLTPLSGWTDDNGDFLLTLAAAAG